MKCMGIASVGVSKRSRFDNRPSIVGFPFNFSFLLDLLLPFTFSVLGFSFQMTKRTKPKPVRVTYEQDPVVYAMVAGMTLSGRQTSIHNHIPSASRNRLSKFLNRSSSTMPVALSTDALPPTAHPTAPASVYSGGNRELQQPTSGEMQGQPTLGEIEDKKGSHYVIADAEVKIRLASQHNSTQDGPYVFAEKYEFLSTCAFDPLIVGGRKKAKTVIEFKSYFPSLFERIRESNLALQRQHSQSPMSHTAGSSPTEAGARQAAAKGPLLPDATIVTEKPHSTGERDFSDILNPPPAAAPTDLTADSPRPIQLLRLQSTLSTSTAENMVAELSYRSSFSDPGYMVSFGALANSGSRFYYTADKRFIVKTIPYEQMKFLQSILHRYSDYISSQPHTLLIRIQALYRIVWWRHHHGLFSHRKGRRHIEYLVVMSNCLSHQSGFDGLVTDPSPSLNGSNQSEKTASRYSVPTAEIQFDMKAWGLKHPQDTRDIQRLMRENIKVTLTPERKEALRQQALKDTEFLASLGVNDYSILLGIFRPTLSVATPEKPLALPEKGATAPEKPLPATSTEAPNLDETDHLYAHRSSHANEVYYLSLIDLLSDWSWNRRWGYYFLPGIWVYFPRYMEPSQYAHRIRQTLDRVLEE